MEHNFSLQSILDIVLLVQAVLFGILLIALDRKQQRHTFYLGVFIILFGLTSVTSIVEELNLTNHYPKLEYLPFDFVWTLFPVFYLYVQEISIFSNHKKYYVLLPGLVDFIFLSSLFFLSEEAAAIAYDSFLYGLFFICGIIYSVIIVIKTFSLIKRHMKSIRDQYSSLEYKEMKWVKYFTLGILLYFSFGLLTLFFAVLKDVADDFLNIFFITASVVELTLVFWASFKGITQDKVTLLISNKRTEDIKEGTLKSEVFREKDESIEKIIESLRKVIQEDQLFKDVNLTIVDVSEKIGVHPRKLSIIINSHIGSNFNQYINNYRVEQSKKLLINDSGSNLTIEGIAFEAGFKSKSSFYAAFKNSTQMTPVNFKKSISKKH